MRIHLASFSLAIAAATASSVAFAAGEEITEPNPKTMSQSEIRAFNAQIDKGHKYFIRCKRSRATGTLVAREYSCRTNEQWTLADARGNQEARDIVDEMSSKAVNTSN